MNKRNILVTGVGAVIGYGIVRSLRDAMPDARITGMDMFPEAAGRRWCDDFVVAPPAASSEYPDFLLSLISDRAVSLVIPGIEQEVSRMNSFRRHIEDISRVALNTPELIALSDDKWQQFEVVTAAGLPAIKSLRPGTFDECADALGLPAVAKHCRMHASQGIRRIESRKDFDYWKWKYGEDFMAQQFVGDDAHEYTAAVFGYGDGTSSQAICLRRALGREGSTRKAWVERIPALEDLCARFAAHFRPAGPTNLQFRLHDGDYLLLEINPRFSSTTSMRAAFGFNEAAMAVGFFLEGKRPRPAEIKTGRAVRYFEDIIEYEV